MLERSGSSTTTSTSCSSKSAAMDLVMQDDSLLHQHQQQQQQPVGPTQDAGTCPPGTHVRAPAAAAATMLAGMHAA